MQMEMTQNNHKLTITTNRDQVKDQQALEAVMNSLSRSKYDSHQAILTQIEKQLSDPVPLVRFSLNASAAARIERSLRYTFSKKRLYPDRGQCDLHEMLCRVLGRRTPARELSYA